MPPQRLTNVVTFKRIRLNAQRDDAGQVDESLPGNWEAFGKRRASTSQSTGTESQGQDQNLNREEWVVICRGDSITKSVTTRDRIEFLKFGELVGINVTGMKSIQDVPHYIEFRGAR